VTKDDDATLGHRNVITYSRTLAGWSHRGAYSDEGGALLFASGTWLPVGGNGAFRTDDALDADELLDRADAFFAQQHRGYSIKVRDTGQDADIAAACEARGMAAFGEAAPEMLCRQRLAEPPLPPGVELRPVADAAGVRDFVTVNTEAYATYGMPADVLPDLFDWPEAVVADANTAIVVAHYDDQPVATALTYVSDGTASLQWVGTVSAARRMRLGEVVTVWATNRAFDMGAPTCTLQASTMGRPLYERLGYETLFHYRDHVCWQPPAG